MHLDVSTRLTCSPTDAWREVQTSRLLQHVTFPLVGFDPLDPPALPAQWQPGHYRVRLKGGMILPLGEHWINISVSVVDGTPGRERYEIRDDGYGALISRWDHRISIAPHPGGGTLYRDQVDVQAGVLTPFVWAFAWLFYHYRQWRWRGLSNRQFVYSNREGAMQSVIGKELRVAFSKRVQPVWFRVLKWLVFIGVTFALRRSARLKLWLLGVPLTGLGGHLIYRWKTAAWTRGAAGMIWPQSRIRRPRWKEQSHANRSRKV